MGGPPTDRPYSEPGRASAWATVMSSKVTVGTGERSSYPLPIATAPSK